MGKFSRAKGARVERQAKLQFIDAGYVAERRGWCQRFQAGHPDILVKDIPALWVEVKGVEKFLGSKLRNALEQAKDDCEQAGPPFEVPCVVSHESNSDWYIHIKLEDFFRACRGDL